jgi:hypothetical protein
VRPFMTMAKTMGHHATVILSSHTRRILHRKNTIVASLGGRDDGYTSDV